MVRHEPRVQSIKREKKSHLGEISPKIRFFGNVREGGGGGGGGGGKNPSTISRVSSVGSR